MQKFSLELLFHIIGIGSASGLFYDGSALFLISDNSHILYEYNIEDKSLSKHPLVNKEYTGPLENIPKPDKADYEAIAVKGSDMYLFGSGSAPGRNLIAHINYKTKEVFPHIDATDLYLAMQSFGNIDAENFNIEAAVNDGDTWYLFQRGNGPAKQNAVFTLNGTIEDTYFQILHNSYRLPKINGERAGFTDAVKVGNTLYFIAAAEKSSSTYHDGEVAGSLIGTIDIETMKIGFTKVISESKKFEGITLFKETDTELQFLLCEDTDSDAGASDIYLLKIPKGK
jgi:hypothetical protein